MADLQNSERPELSSILEGLFNQGGGGVSPWIQGGLGFASQLAGSLYDSPDKKTQRWERGQRKDFYDQLRWGEMNQGDVLSPGDIDAEMSMFKRSIRPDIMDMVFNADKTTSGGERDRLVAGSLAAPLARRRGELASENRALTQNRDQFTRQLMAQILGGSS